MTSNDPQWGLAFNSMKSWVPWLLGLAGTIHQLFIASTPNPLLVGFILLLLGLPGASQLATALWQQRASAQSGSAASSSASSSLDSLLLEGGNDDGK